MNVDIGFIKGFVYRKNLLYVIAAIDDLDERDIYHAIIFRWFSGEWGNWAVQNRIISICVFDGTVGRTVMAMGIDGRIQVGDSMGFHWEKVDDGDEAPSMLRHLSAMRLIGNHIYVAGMARQVYRRAIRGGSWERADRGALVPRNSLEIAGFNAIDGLHEGDIYAVGLHGQIWHSDGDRWNQLDSPVNSKLECVKCVAPDLVYISGANGIVIRGDKDRWEVLNNQETRSTFWGMEYFLHTLYLSTDQRAIFSLDHDEIVPVDIGFGKEVTTYWLHANDEVLLSVGPQDLVLFDGEMWTEIAHP